MINDNQELTNKLKDLSDLILNNDKFISEHIIGTHYSFEQINLEMIKNDVLFENARIVNKNKTRINNKTKEALLDDIIKIMNAESVKTAPSCEGLYLYIAKDNFKVNIGDLFFQFLHYSYDLNGISCDIFGTPKINLFHNEKEGDILYIQKGDIIYCGTSKNLYSRRLEHESSIDYKINSMKFTIRKDLKEHVVFKCIKNIDFAILKMLERDIHKYFGTRFGR